MDGSSRVGSELVVGMNRRTWRGIGGGCPGEVGGVADVVVGGGDSRLKGDYSSQAARRGKHPRRLAIPGLGGHPYFPSSQQTSVSPSLFFRPALLLVIASPLPRSFIPSLTHALVQSAHSSFPPGACLLPSSPFFSFYSLACFCRSPFGACLPFDC